MRARLGLFGLVVLLLSGVPVAAGTAGADSITPGGTDSNLCGLQFCPPDPPPPDEPPPPYVQITAWSYNTGTGVWEQASAGLPPAGLAGDDYRLLAQLKADDGTLIPDAEVSIDVNENAGYECDQIASAPAPLPPGAQTEIRLRADGGYPCLFSAAATYNGKSYYRSGQMEAVQLSPKLTWLSAGGVPIDVDDWESLGTVFDGDTRTFGVRTDDPLADVSLIVEPLAAASQCSVEPLGAQEAGTRYFRITGGPGTGNCYLRATSARASEWQYSPYAGEALQATLSVGSALWFGWVRGWEPPVAFAYPSDPVPVKAGADFTSVNITAGGPCTVQTPAIYGWDPWLITPTGVGDCVLTITALVIDLDNPDDSFPAITYAIPVLPAAAPNAAPQAAFTVYQPSTGAPSTVQFDATGSSDPDGDALTYLWDFGDGTGGSGAIAPAVYATPGTYSVTLTVMDPYGTTDTATQTVTVTDPTPPIITPIVQGPVGGGGWRTGDVDISWQVIDPESSVSSTTGCDAVIVATDTGPNGSTITCSATSEGGTTTKSFSFGRDATAPSLTPAVTPDAIPLGGSATVDANATDPSSGVAGASCGPVDTTSLGTKSVTCTATDHAGNTAQATVQYSVVLGWQGFTGTVQAPPVLNTVRAGRRVPVSFSLGGFRGLHIFAAGSPSATRVRCPSGAPSNAVATTRPSRHPSLAYDVTSGTYTYWWPTDARWRGTCRDLKIRLVDGTEYHALFDFR